jgi:hypothetical protein
MPRNGIALLLMLLAVACDFSSDRVAEPKQGGSRRSDLDFQRYDIVTGESVTIRSGGVPFIFVSPGNKSEIILNSSIGKRLVISIEPPGSIAWHPKRLIFYVNNGFGSGQGFEATAYAVESGVTTKGFDVTGLVRERFVSSHVCNIEPGLLSVEAVGWFKTESSLLVLVESWDRDRPCSTLSARAMKVNLHPFVVAKVYSITEVREGFCNDQEFHSGWRALCDTPLKDLAEVDAFYRNNYSGSSPSPPNRRTLKPLPASATLSSPTYLTT